jgi:hypothetical protein
MWVPVLKKGRQNLSFLKKGREIFSIPQIKFYHYNTGLYECFAYVRMCDYNILSGNSLSAARPFFTTLATNVHSNSGTYIFCAKVTEVIFEIIDRRRAPHWVGFGIHSS